MEQQAIKIGRPKLPPSYPTIGLLQPGKQRTGKPNCSPGVSHRPTSDRLERAKPAGVVPWASWLRERSSRQGATLLPDLDRAFINPASVFDAPQDVVRHPLLTIECKREILGRWAWDEHLLELAAAEGMPEGGPSRLDEVKAALRLVSKEHSPDPAAPAALIIPYRWDENALAA